MLKQVVKVAFGGGLLTERKSAFGVEKKGASSVILGQPHQAMHAKASLGNVLGGQNQNFFQLRYPL